jgi:hypothetical protein
VKYFLVAQFLHRIQGTFACSPSCVTAPKHLLYCVISKPHHALCISVASIIYSQHAQMRILKPIFSLNLPAQFTEWTKLTGCKAGSLPCQPDRNPRPAKIPREQRYAFFLSAGLIRRARLQNSRNSISPVIIQLLSQRLLYYDFIITRALARSRERRRRAESHFNGFCNIRALCRRFPFALFVHSASRSACDTSSSL